MEAVEECPAKGRKDKEKGATDLGEPKKVRPTRGPDSGRHCQRPTRTRPQTRGRVTLSVAIRGFPKVWTFGFLDFVFLENVS